ncbi:MAG TPA: TetR family transcriptional regulator [Allosphingosinicella sp.]|nr:TetR family transcriptional regulator [Allosphingosinicella sp.]
MKPAAERIEDITSPAQRPAKASRKPKLSRAEKAEKIRQDLFRAAASVVGEHGYLNAMILMITSKANVANGTFYNYFESQQDLFDQLLPGLGREMLDFIAERSRSGETELERERQRFEAFFEFLRERPEFYRILYEAEVFAQDAHDAHMRQVMKGYSGVLRKALNSGEITGYTSRELDVVALILMGARHYIAMRYLRQEEGDGTLPDWAARTYNKFIAGGLKAIAADD